MFIPTYRHHWLFCFCTLLFFFWHPSYTCLCLTTCSSPFCFRLRFSFYSIWLSRYILTLSVVAFTRSSFIVFCYLFFCTHFSPDPTAFPWKAGGGWVRDLSATAVCMEPYNPRTLYKFVVSCLLSFVLIFFPISLLLSVHLCLLLLYFYLLVSCLSWSVIVLLS